MKPSRKRTKRVSPDSSILADGVVSDGTERKLVEEARDYLAFIVESSDDAILGKSTEGVIQSWNAGAERLYGYTASEIIGQSIFLLVPPDRREEFEGFLERIKQGEAVENHETVRVAKGGRHIHVSVTISPIKSASGEVIGASSVARDITERKRADEALRLAQFSVEHASDAIYWVDSQGRIVYVNEAACRSLERSREEILALTIPEIDPLFPKEGWGTFWEEIKPRGSMTFETQHRTKHGKVFPVEITANYLEFNGKEYSFAFARDITERQRTEAGTPAW